MEIPQNEAGSAGYGNGCDHGRRDCFQLKSGPGLRLSQQPMAKRAQGATPHEHQGDRHGFFIDRHTLSQKPMNRFQKVVKIKATPANDLDLPEGSQMQGIISIHEEHFSLSDESAFHGLAHDTLGSSHLSIDQRISSRLSTSFS